MRGRLNLNSRATGKSSVALDASAIILLSKLGYLKEILGLFDNIEVCPAVLGEIGRKKDSVYFEFMDMLKSNKIKIEDIEHRFPSLGAGESSTIYLGLLKKKPIVLDDKRARRLARELGLVVIGTISLLKRLYELGKLKEKPEELYIRLRQLRFRIKREIFEKIFC